MIVRLAFVLGWAGLDALTVLLHGWRLAAGLLFLVAFTALLALAVGLVLDRSG